MNLFDILFMQKTGKVKPDADLFDILFAKVTGAVERLVTILGNPLHFTAKKAQTAQSTRVTLEPIQEGSGDPSPTNIRPISGRSSVEIKGCGKNRHNGEVYIANKYIGSSGNLVDSNNYNVYKLNGVSACECTLSVYDNTEGLTNIVLCAQGFDDNNNQTFLNYTTHPSSKSRESITFTVPSGTSYVLYCFRISDYDIQVETGSATAYKPYAESNDVTITFGETVYGGTLDVETGVCMVDKIMYRLYTLSWTYSSTTGSFTNKKGSKNIKMNSTPICSCFIGMPSVNSNAAVASMGDNRIVLKRSADDQRIYAKYSEANGDVDVFISAVNGQYICCQMETPSTITLTPEQIQILKGENNIWIDDVGAVMELSYMD